VNLAPHIAKAEARLQEIEVELSLFDFKAPGSDGRRYQALHREYQRLSRIRNLWGSLQTAKQQLQDNRDLLASETDPEFLAVVRHDLHDLELRLPVLDRELKTLILPPRPNEDRDVIVEIRPAAGGDEAGLFAGDLFRMYTRYAESRGWRVDLLELSESDLGGIKDVAFSLHGSDAFAHLCYESGVHRVQRVPVTEAAGRIHTSTVTVAMLPEAQEVDIVIDPEDLRIDTFRASGHGGQNVNRTDSAVRVTHLPTGIFFACQQEKSQHRNREIAMLLLRSRLLQIKQDEENAKYAAERRQQVGTGERSERIRTYNFPQNRVTDHRYELTRYDLPEIISGERFGELVESIIAKDVERRLTEELR
jgi:peptide chain release factor 1